MIPEHEAKDRRTSTVRIFSRDFVGWERRVFFLGLILKLGIGSVLASAYLTDLFIPFVGEFVGHPFLNPYATFVAANEGRAFPYPAGMLYVLALPEILLQMFGITSPVVTLMAYRVVILAADATIYFSLRAWLSLEHARRLILLYWLSPVAFYINYIHGQLDAIPIALLAVSLVLLFSGRLVTSGLVFGLALSAKTSIGLIAPVFFLYLFQRPQTAWNFVRFGIMLTLIWVLVNLPFLLDRSFVEMVLMNREQAKVFSIFISFEDANFQIIFATWVLLLAFAARVGIGNRNLFVMFIGFFYCVILIMIPPMVGWYYWIVPFFAFFFAKEPQVSPGLFFGLQAFYFLYFLISPDSDYLQVFQLFTAERPPLGVVHSWLEGSRIDAQVAFDAAFTLLQTTLLLLCVQVYRRGIRRYRVQKITGRPFLLGIGGNSGTGKSKLTNALEGIFGKDNTTILRGDDRHKWQRGHDQWKTLTHLNPKANHLHTEIDTLRALKSGRKIWRRMYDHDTGTFTNSMAVVAKRLMILEGLHPFYLSDQRTLFDLRVFVTPEETLATHWKICRDKKKRNYTTEKVMAQIEARRADVENYINPQRQFADVVISPCADRPIEPLGDESFEFEVHYNIWLSNNFQLEAALELLGHFQELEIEHDYEQVNHQRLTIRGSCSKDCNIAMFAYFEEHLYELSVRKMVLPVGLFGVVIFILLHVIFQEAERA